MTDLVLPKPDDPRDGDFMIAHKSLGAIIDQGLEDLKEGWKPGRETRRHERLGFLLLGHTWQEMANAFHALKPLENTIGYGSMASDALRTLCDIFGRQLGIWGAVNPADALAGDVAEGLRQEMLSLDAARSAGVDLLEVRAVLERAQREVGALPRPVAVANELARHGEHETLCVFRWESSHVHMGHAAVAASGRSVRGEGINADVVMYPMSLWRAGQITWAVYGIGIRLASFLTANLSIELPGVDRLDEEVRPLVRKASMRAKRPDEPASPTYGRFEFPRWSQER